MVSHICTSPMIHSRTNASAHASYRTYDSVTSDIWLSHVSHMDESWDTKTQVWGPCMVSHICMSPMIHSRTNASAHAWYCTYSSCTSHIALMTDSRLIHDWVTSHIWMSHVIHWQIAVNEAPIHRVIHMNERYDTLTNQHKRPCVVLHLWLNTSHVWTSHVSHMNASCNTLTNRHKRDVHASYHTYECLMRYTHKPTHSRTNACPCVLVTYDSVTSHIWMNHAIHSRTDVSEVPIQIIRHVAHVNERVMSHIRMSHTWMSHVTHVHVTNMNESCHTCECVTNRRKRGAHAA